MGQLLQQKALETTQLCNFEGSKVEFILPFKLSENTTYLYSKFYLVPVTII